MSSALWRLRQEVLEFKVSLGYTMRPNLKQSDLFTRHPTDLEWNIKHSVHRCKNHTHNFLEADGTLTTRDTITRTGRRR